MSTPVEPQTTAARGAAARWGGWIVFGAAVLVFANTGWNGFALDDEAIVRDNPAVVSAEHWWAPCVLPYWPNSNRGDRDDLLYRPLTVQTYRWQHALTGRAPWAFHLFNVLLHAAVSVGVWRIARRLGSPAGAALFAGVVFAVHPLHTDAVSNIVGRAELLAAGGTLAALAFALSARAPATRWQRTLRWVAAWTFAALALAAKENGVAALVVVGFVALVPLRVGVRTAHGSADRCVESRIAGPLPDGRGSVRGRLLCALLPAALIFSAYLAVRYQVCADRLIVLGQRVAVSNPLRDVEGLPRWLTPPALLGRYLLMTVMPQRFSCDYSWRALPPLTSAANVRFWIGVAFVAGCVLLAVRRGPRRTLWWLVLAGFASSYFLASNSLLLIDVIFAERLWYSPSIWVCVALAFGVAVIMPRLGERERWVRWCGTALVVVLGLQTVVRNPDWRDSRTVVERDLAGMPADRRSAQLCAFLGQFLTEDGDYERAEALLREAIAIYPDKALYHRALGKLYMAMNQPRKAVAALQDALIIDPSRPEFRAQYEQAKFAAEGRDLKAEYAAARAAARKHPDDLDAVRAWARLAETADPVNAVTAYRRLVVLDGDNAESWSGLALAQFATGDPTASAETYRAILARWPDDWNAHTNLALLLMDITNRALFDSQAALLHARRAVELNPTHWQLQVNLAEVTAACGGPSAAAELFEELARQSPPGSREQRLFQDRARYLRQK